MRQTKKEIEKKLLQYHEEKENELLQEKKNTEKLIKLFKKLVE